MTFLTGLLRQGMLAVLVALGSLGATAALLAQTPALGRITGRVVDSTQNPLPGATVRLGDRIVSASPDGEFHFLRVPAGGYSLIVSYIGFHPSEFPVQVQAGKESRVNIRLRRGDVTLPEISVTASRPRGDAQALNQQKNADNIVDVLPADVITSLPNTNVADAVGRLPGVTLERDEGEGKYVQIRGTEPRLSNVTINGVHIPSPEGGARNVKLDVIPSDLIGAIELNKTLSADLDGDAIGGSVNLVTKTPGDRPTAQVEVLGGYTDLQHGRSLYQFTGTAGGRFGAARRFGVLVGATYDWNGRGIDDIEPGPGTFGASAEPSVGAIDYRLYTYGRKRLGVAGALDFQLSPGSSLTFRALYSRFKNYGKRWVNSLGLGDQLTSTTADSNGNIIANVQNRTPDEQVYSLVGGGKHDLGGLLLDYSLAYSRSSQARLNQRTTEFAGPSNVAYGVDLSNPNYPRLPVLNGVDIADPAAFELDNSSVQNDRTAERDIAGAVNFTLPYQLGGRVGALKFGGKYRDGRKDQTVDQQDFTASGGPVLTMDQVLGNNNTAGFYKGHYQFGVLADFDLLEAFFKAHPSALELDVNGSHADSDPNNYLAKERVTAGYVMNTLQIGRLHTQVGVRVEATRADYTGNLVHFDTAGAWQSSTPTSGTRRYTDLLPSINLRLEIDPRTNLRLAYGRGIARPVVSDLVPFRVLDDAARQIDVGNPDLKPTSANDFDLLFEHYLRSVGVISAGVFYKDLHDPIYDSKSAIIAGTDSGFNQSRKINGAHADVFGVEMAWQQALTFLPSGLNGLGILANFTYTTSKATVPGRNDRPALLRQAPVIWNLGLTYDRGGFSARAALTHNGASIFQYNFEDGADGGIKGPNGDNYLYSRTQLDAQVSYLFQARVQLVLNVLNLNNAVFGFYNGDPKFVVQREFYGPTFSLGLRYTH